MSALSEALTKANVHNWSSREIARRGGNRVSHTQLAKYLKAGHPNPTDQVLSVFAEVFPVLTLPKLRDLAGLPAGEDEPYSPPPEADRLNHRQRRALDELIRSMVTAETQTAAHDFSDRVEPDIVKVLEAGRRRAAQEADQPVAARRGTPNLRSVKKQQDEAGQAPDADGPEGGA